MLRQYFAPMLRANIVHAISVGPSHNNKLTLAGRVCATCFPRQKQSSYNTEGMGGQFAGEVEKYHCAGCLCMEV